MKTADAIAYFGGVKPLAEALGITVFAVYQWDTHVPPLRVYEIREIAAARAQALLGDPGRGNDDAR